MRRICFFGFLSIALTIAFVSSSIYSERQVALDEARSDTSGMVRFLAMDIDRTFYGISQMFTGIHNLLQSSPECHIPNSPAVRKILLELQKQNPYLMDLLVLNHQGEIIHWTGPGPTPDVRDRDYSLHHVKQGDDALFIGKPALSRVHQNRWFFGVSQAIYSDEGKLELILVAATDLDYFKQRYSNLDLPFEAMVTITSTNGDIYTRIPGHNQSVGKNVPGVASILRNLDQRMSVHITSPVDQTRLLSSVERVGNTNLVAAVSISEKVFFAQWYKHSIWLSAFGVGVIGILLTLSILTLRSQQQQLRTQKLLHKQAITDHLTGLANRRYAMEQASLEIKKNQRSNTPLSLALMDIDHFKLVNDNYGHDMGDDVLRAVADVFRQHCRESDLVSRIGGEEFLLMMPATDLNGAAINAEKIRQALKARPFNHAGKTFNITASFGLAQWDNDTEINSVLRRADAALYQAKDDGRDCIRPQLS